MEWNGQTMFLPDKPQPAAAAYRRGDPVHAPRTRFLQLPNHAPVGQKLSRRTNSHLQGGPTQVQTVQNMMHDDHGAEANTRRTTIPQRSTFHLDHRPTARDHHPSRTSTVHPSDDTVTCGRIQNTVGTWRIPATRLSVHPESRPPRKLRARHWHGAHNRRIQPVQSPCFLEPSPQLPAAPDLRSDHTYCTVRPTMYVTSQA